MIAGWTEAMQLMVEGDKWEMYIPSELAYGSRGSPPKIGNLPFLGSPRDDCSISLVLHPFQLRGNQ